MPLEYTALVVHREPQTLKTPTRDGIFKKILLKKSLSFAANATFFGNSRGFSCWSPKHSNSREFRDERAGYLFCFLFSWGISS